MYYNNITLRSMSISFSSLTENVFSAQQAALFSHTIISLRMDLEVLKLERDWCSHAGKQHCSTAWLDFSAFGWFDDTAVPVVVLGSVSRGQQDCGDGGARRGC